jgi:hypothetical protein
MNDKYGNILIKTDNKIIVKNINYVGNQCVEDLLFFYINHNKLKTYLIPKIDILTNINSEGIYRIY